METRVKIYTTDWCGYCHRAKGLLRRKGIAYTEIDVDGDWERRAWLSEVTHQHTVPQIFIDDQSIGGCDELHALDVTGELDRLLEPQDSRSKT